MRRVIDASAAIGGEPSPRALALIEMLMLGLFDAMDRVIALEREPFEFAGVHEMGKAYRPGQFVSYDGSLWACRAVTSLRPTDAPCAWTLAVKRGRDAR